MKTFQDALQVKRSVRGWCTLLAAGCLFPMSVIGVARAQVPYGLTPLPSVAGVPFHPNVFGAAATDAAAARSSAGKTVSGMPRNVYAGHASVVMWVDANGKTRYSAALAQHSTTFAMSKARCAEQNGGDASNCKPVYDAAARALAVVESSDGGYYFVPGESKADARKRGMEACEKRANVTCKLDKVFGSGGGLFE